MSAEATGEVRVDHLVTHGTFSLDGGSWEVDNNVWIVGDGAEVVVVDPAHDASAVFAAVSGRRVSAILLSHGHDDHIRAVAEFQELTGAPVHLHPRDQMLWQTVYPAAALPLALADGDVFALGTGSRQLAVLHTPGHSPGSCCFYSAELGAVFTGDTLFQHGPGATGRSYSDFPTIIESIRDTLFRLPPDTVVYPGHGDSTTIGGEIPQLADWIARGR